MDISNPVARAVASAVRGTVLLPGLYLRGQLGRDREITLNAMAGLCLNPNIAGVVVIGLEPASTAELSARIAASKKPVGVVNIQPAGGTINAIAAGTRLAARMVRQISKLRPREFPVSKLMIGVECGGSDTTSGLSSNPAIGVVADRVVEAGGQVIISETAEFFGAELLFAQRAKTPEVREKFLREIAAHEEGIIAQGVDLRGNNPSQDNIRGGLTTIEEKALGSMAKSGKSELVGVLEYGERPRVPGLHFMAAPASAVENLTALAAAGCQLCVFSTGVGNPIGHPVSTIIKVTGNRNTAETFADNIDFEVTDILERNERIEEAGGRLFEYVLSVASGELTSSEILDVRETIISRFGTST
jgi:altronate dehydratase large subunit